MRFTHTVYTTFCSDYRIHEGERFSVRRHHPIDKTVPGHWAYTEITLFRLGTHGSMYGWIGRDSITRDKCDRICGLINKPRRSASMKKLVAARIRGFGHHVGCETIYWIPMYKDVEEYVKQCDKCTKVKTRAQT